MGHACEWETSMMLVLHADLVRPWQDLAPVPFHETPGAQQAWITKDISTPGHIGSPHAASAEKGERLLNHFSQGVISLLRRVVTGEHEQRV